MKNWENPKGGSYFGEEGWEGVQTCEEESPQEEGVECEDLGEEGCLFVLTLKNQRKVIWL